MAAAYGVPLGGALFALEVLRGALALRFVLPALVTSLVATGISWAFLPDTPTYLIPDYAGSISSHRLGADSWPGRWPGLRALCPAVAWADRHKPKGWRRLLAPVVALGLLGAASIPFPQLLGNGRDVAELAFTGQLGPVAAAGPDAAAPGRDPDVPGQRRARRSVHALPDVRGDVGRRAWTALDMALARRAAWGVRSARRRRRCWRPPRKDRSRPSC